jgi:predicted DNA-binding transcriptional regulator AlpA
MNTNQEETNGVEQLWSRKIVAQRFDYSTRTINDWMAKGWLPYVKIGKSVRFVPGDVEAFINAHRIGK